MSNGKEEWVIVRGKNESKLLVRLISSIYKQIKSCFNNFSTYNNHEILFKKN